MPLTVSNTVNGHATKGMDYLTGLRRNERSNNSHRKVNGRIETQLVQIACSPAPKSHSGWAIRLLEDELKVVLNTAETIIREAIRKAKKQIETSQKLVYKSYIVTGTNLLIFSNFILAHAITVIAYQTIGLRYSNLSLIICAYPYVIFFYISRFFISKVDARFLLHFQFHFIQFLFSLL